MPKNRKPNDDEILEAVSRHGSRAMTYVVSNVLWRMGFHVETPWVLRQLKRLEKAGRVHRVPTSYAVQIGWSATPSSSNPATEGDPA